MRIRRWDSLFFFFAEGRSPPFPSSPVRRLRGGMGANRVQSLVCVCVWMCAFFYGMVLKAGRVQVPSCCGVLGHSASFCVFLF